MVHVSLQTRNLLYQSVYRRHSPLGLPLSCATS